MGNSRDISLDVPEGWTVGGFAAIYDHKDRVLISERRDGKGWNLPGGMVAPGMSLTDELRREVFEETGLELPGEPSLIKRYPSEKLQDVALLFLVEAVGEPRPSDEAVQHRFVDLEILSWEVRLVSQLYPGHGFGRMWGMVTDALIVRQIDA